ncbi:hypothetical protein OOJ09_29435 [Mesorhizobium qingshengii]|uniref:Cytochrome c domain-containing protein n=1 Tax=Mesorhizobium qingshengii TaxID=1165689 RepID=A0ABT4R3H5_9HYPH|nr:hypothetical protein [Mesorhizobium qingshengii]MCZ8548314.1 hypothetical protein [Mesorhizobium qingshengii]
MRLLKGFQTLWTVLLLAWGATAASADEVISDPGIGIRVAPGSQAETTTYYERISTKLGVADTRRDLPSLTALLRHLGYRSLTAEDLEFKSPSDLMATFPNDQLLVSRFFAPKIVDFNVKSADTQYPYSVGWRKLVRITALPGSGADSAGLEAAYVLFNYVQMQLTDAPFPDGTSFSESVNTQVIIVPRTFAMGREDSAYFLDFDTRTGGYEIHDFLSAAFDVAQDPNHPEKTKRNYYVPTACAQCHGHDQEGGGPTNGVFPYAKLNYLDTDQWYDMMAFGEFPSTLGTYDVLFDGGLDHSTGAYGAAFDVIRKLNNFIRNQNSESVHSGDIDLFKIKAVDKWLALHQTSADPVPALARALDLENGSAIWQDTQDDRALLGLLDQYCFRCHSSVLYSVFDKQAVADRWRTIARYVQLPADNASHMPQGRQLDAQTIADIVKYVQALK